MAVQQSSSPRVTVAGGILEGSIEGSIEPESGVHSFDVEYKEIECPQNHKSND